MLRRRAFFATAALPFGAGRAFAQIGARLGRIVVPFPAGGGTDAVARTLAEKLRAAYPGGLIVENRPGASGRRGIEAVKDAPADGSTLLLVPDLVMTLYPYSFRHLGYDPVRDFAPVALCSTTSYAVVAGPALPASVTNVRQYLAWCKANPTKAAYASTSAGSPSHFIGAALASAAGIAGLHVPYKGGPQALQDLLGGMVPVSTNPIGEVLPYLKDAKLRVLAVTGARRSTFLPATPTLVEAGLTDLAIDAWVGIFAPAKTPPPTLAALAHEVDDALRDQALVDTFKTLAQEPVHSTPAALSERIVLDQARWAGIVKRTNFTALD